MIVDRPRAVARHLGRCRVDEVPGVGRNHLHVDPELVHVRKARLEVGQFRKVDLAALLRDALGEVVDVRVGIGGFAAAGNAGRLQHHRVRLRHHAVAMDVDGAPAFGAAGARRRAAVIGRGAAYFALEQHRSIHSEFEGLLAARSERRERAGISRP
jgi:hypothetical protein